MGEGKGMRLWATVIPSGIAAYAKVLKWGIYGLFCVFPKAEGRARKEGLGQTVQCLFCYTKELVIHSLGGKKRKRIIPMHECSGEKVENEVYRGRN